MANVEGTYIKFPVLDKDSRFLEYVYRPHVELRINYKRGKISPPLEMLLDTGADRCLFPAQIGNYFVGDFRKKGKKFVTTGIGDYQILTYRIGGFKFFVGAYEFETQIDFSEECKYPLLGGIGFFDHFKRVTFCKKDEKVKLEY